MRLLENNNDIDKRMQKYVNILISKFPITSYFFLTDNVKMNLATRSSEIVGTQA